MTILPTAPPGSIYDDEAAMLDLYSQQRRQQQQQQYGTSVRPPRVPPPCSSSFEDPDARLARQLEQEEKDAQFARDVEEQLRQEERLHQLREQSARDAQLATSSNTLPIDDDERVARQVEQQLRDEELARQYALAEEQALAAREQQAVAATRSGRRRFCTYMVPCIIVGVGIAVVLLVLRNTNGDQGFSIPGFGSSNNGPFLTDSDPFDGLEPWEVARWRTRNNNQGLTLTVMNALQSRMFAAQLGDDVDNDTWDDIFPLVIADWDNGTPDALTLNTVIPVEGDAACEPVDGRSKVCNDNYGDTQWKGINLAILQQGYIVASTSKMNEYYLARADTAQRRYTLCHEIGHSFGLPHTDEDFYNQDLGNCMDYTSNPEANQSPDETNFQFLQDLYGTIPSSTSTAAVASAPVKEDNDGNRRLRGQQDGIKSTTIPDSIRQQLREIVPEMEQHRGDATATASAPHGWRLLHASPEHGHTHERDLGNGWSVKVHKLLASN